MTHPDLVCGPLLRYVDATSATVWVEVDRPATVEVLGRTAHTFTVHGHHYAIVAIEDLEAGTEHPYEVALDGRRAWPPPDADQPPSTIRTHPADATDHAWQVVFGSCRRVQGHDDDPHPDALRVFGERLAAEPDRRTPDLLVMLGDQVYACQVSPRTQAFIEARRGTDPDPRTDPPPGEVKDFVEFAELYAESWGTDPHVRWLLSTVPSTMIFDDHDIIDDWNISADWVEEMRGLPWWHDRVIGGLMAYWLYQHLGNLSPEELAEDRTLLALQDHEGDAGDLLESIATPWDRGTGGTPGPGWSFSRRLGDVHLVVVDSRNGRCLGPGERDMLDADEWAWLEERVAEPASHILLASSLPFLLMRGTHDAEAWSSQLCDGIWGSRAARAAEALRQAVDLEHWAAFQRSFQRISKLIADVADGRVGDLPASVLLLSGDVHCAYTAPADTGPDQRADVWQLTCSPMHYLVEPSIKAAFQAAASTAGHWAGRVLRRTARAPSPELDWTLADGPEFGSFLATLDLDGPRAEVVFERADPDGFTPRMRRLLSARRG